MAEQSIVESKLDKAISEYGLGAERAKAISLTFGAYWDKAVDLCSKADSIAVSDATQVSEMKKARSLRLELKEVRVSTEKSRKEFKESALREGQAIDKAAGFIKSAIEPVESRLEEMEKFAERAEAKRKSELRASRETLLAPYGIDTQFYQLGDMTEQAFDILLGNTRSAHEQRIAAEKKAAEEKAAAELARAEEEKRIRAENERLRIEAEKKEKEAAAERARIQKERDAERAKLEKEMREAADKARKEREEIEAQAAKERAERAQAEARLIAKEQEEKRKREAEERAKKKAALAPDKEKLSSLAASFRAFALPELKSPEGTAILAEIAGMIDRLAKWIETKSAQM